jgi:hypothetical protein
MSPEHKTRAYLTPPVKNARRRRPVPKLSSPLANSPMNRTYVTIRLTRNRRSSFDNGAQIASEVATDFLDSPTSPVSPTGLNPLLAHLLLRPIEEEFPVEGSCLSNSSTNGSWPTEESRSFDINVFKSSRPSTVYQPLESASSTTAMKSIYLDPVELKEEMLISDLQLKSPASSSEEDVEFSIHSPINIEIEEDVAYIGPSSLAMSSPSFIDSPITCSEVLLKIFSESDGSRIKSVCKDVDPDAADVSHAVSPSSLPGELTPQEFIEDYFSTRVASPVDLEVENASNAQFSPIVESQFPMGSLPPVPSTTPEIESFSDDLERTFSLNIESSLPIIQEQRESSQQTIIDEVEVIGDIPPPIEKDSKIILGISRIMFRRKTRNRLSIASASSADHYPRRSVSLPRIGGDLSVEPVLKKSVSNWELKGVMPFVSRRNRDAIPEIPMSLMERVKSRLEKVKSSERLKKVKSFIRLERIRSFVRRRRRGASEEDLKMAERMLDVKDVESIVKDDRLVIEDEMEVRRMSTSSEDEMELPHSRDLILLMQEESEEVWPVQTSPVSDFSRLYADLCLLNLSLDEISRKY